MFLGIDYGAKLAGTTAMCFLESDSLSVIQTEKKEDADLKIKSWISEYQPEVIFLDAPLSLPGGFLNLNENYFYRNCDKQLKAMSPMFIGGLTARAIKLKKELRQVRFKEVYPGGLIRNSPHLKHSYNKKTIRLLESFIPLLLSEIPFPISSKINNWHQIDAIICWYIGWKYMNGQAEEIGNKNEGTILI